MHRLSEQFAGVVEERGRYDAQSRDAEEELLDALTVRGSIAATAAHGRPDDQRNLNAAAVHLLVLDRVIDDLVARERQEIAEHHFHDGSQTLKSSADSQSDDSRLADGRREDPIGETCRQPLGHFEGPAVWIQQVLPQKDDCGVLFHQRVQTAAK